jgi:hypothetical protein
MMNNGHVLVVQGPDKHVQELSLILKGQNVIFSTWCDSENGHKHENLKNFGGGQNQHVVCRPMPIWRGRNNLNLQKQSTLTGLHLARELGYEFSFKIRSDMVLTGVEELMDLLQAEVNKGPARIFFFDWVLHRTGYPMDFVQFGKTQDLIRLWSSVSTMPLTRLCPEELLKKAFRNSFLKKSDDKNVWKQIGFMAAMLNAIPNGDLNWIKNDINFRDDWRGNPVFVQCSGLN